MYHQQKQLTDKDETWIAQSSALGETICLSYGIGHSGELTPADLDAAFRAWKEDSREEKPSVADVVNGFGSLFGTLMVVELGLRWLIVTDDFGTSLALVRPPSTWETFPIDFVAKRADPHNNEFGFFVGMQKMMRNELFKGG